MPWLETARELAGKVDVLQLREKDMTDAELLLRARALRELTRETQTLLVINDRPDIALLSEADGVHLGQDDLAAEDVAGLWGERLIVGLSTHSFTQAGEAMGKGVDYIGIGPVFPTDTKDAGACIGIGVVSEICRSADLPVVAIGGIDGDNARRLAQAGVQAVAALSALCAAEYPGVAARRLRQAFER